jgi:hypothetical protein
MTQPLIPTKALEAQLPFSALRAQRAQSLMNFSEWLGEQIADSPESNAEANFEVEIPPPLESAMPAWEHPALTSSPEVADALADDSAFLMPQLSAAPQVEEFTPDQLAAAIPDTTLLPQPSKTQLKRSPKQSRERSGSNEFWRSSKKYETRSLPNRSRQFPPRHYPFLNPQVCRQ